MSSGERIIQNKHCDILSPAKINLFLHITGKRLDGYHELFSLMCRVSLYDTVSLSFGVENTTISCNVAQIPQDETNTAWKAANVFFKALKNKHEGVKIFIDKQIPVGAGLGGGSSNAAAVLLGLNRFYNYPFLFDELISMGVLIGADVPFFIFQKPAIATGIGEILKAYDKLKPYKILLVYPGFSVSTAKIYKNFNFRLTQNRKKFIEPFFDLKNNLENDLETVAEFFYPEISLVKQALINQGACGTLMCGSGSAVFGIFSDFSSAEKAHNILSQNKKWKIFHVDMLI